MNFPEHFLNIVGKPLKEAVSLRDYSNFRIGGEADYFFEAASLQELSASVRLARQHALPYYVIGEGYNLLFDDKGFRGLIIKNRVKGVKLGGKEGKVEAFSGTPLKDLIHFSIKKELCSFEFLAGIPGTVGGAVYTNAGAFNQHIGNFLTEGIILNERGEEVPVTRDYFEFSYRQSILQKKHHVLLKASFQLQKGKREKIKEQIERNLELRKRKHPQEGTACAGSYFKNPVLRDGKRIPAAYFLEKVGAKNLEEGGAAVYAGHANFIINQKGASAKNVLRLAQRLKIQVREKYGLELQEEVVFLPADSSMP